MKQILVSVFQVLITIIVPVASFTTGLQTPGTKAQRLWRRPGTLAKALLAILILGPLWALFVVELLPLANVAKAGLLIAIVAVGIGPLSAMKRTGGDTAEGRDALDLNLVVLILSIAFVPAAVAALTAIFHRPVHLGPGPVAKVVVGRALAPLLLGMAAERWRPKLAASVAPALAKIVTVGMLVVLVIGMAAIWRPLLSVGAVGWLACALTAAGATLIGHALGGPDPGTRGAVAVASAMRFPALGLALAELAQEQKRVVPVVLAYVLAAFVSVAVYGLVRARQRARRGRPERARISAAAPA